MTSNILKDRIHARVAQTPDGAYQVALARAREAIKENRDHKDVARDLEPTIMNDWRFARLYAQNILEGRFIAFEFAVQEAEPATNPDDQLAVFHYASAFGEWPEAEKHIINNADLAVRYAEQVIKQPWPDGHPANDAIARNDAELERYSRTFPTATSACRF